MITRDYQLFLSDINLTKETIAFFTSEITNPQKFEEIKKICVPMTLNFNKINANKLIEMGYLSTFDFGIYFSEINIFRINPA